MVASVPCVSDSDDAYYDATRKRIYAPGGEGFEARHFEENYNYADYSDAK